MEIGRIRTPERRIIGATNPTSGILSRPSPEVTKPRT